MGAAPAEPDRHGTPQTPTRKAGALSDHTHTYHTVDNKAHHFHVYKKDAREDRPPADSTVAEQLKENEYAAANGLLKPEKTIDFFGSFALISNNISGPAMMGLPHLFHTAGMAPVIVAIAATFFGSSLVGTLMSDAIASMPGNADFERNLSFSKAFRIILGPGWYDRVPVLTVATTCGPSTDPFPHPHPHPFSLSPSLFLSLSLSLSPTLSLSLSSLSLPPPPPGTCWPRPCSWCRAWCRRARPSWRRRRASTASSPPSSSARCGNGASEPYPYQI